MKESDYGKNITSEFTCITDQIKLQIYMKSVVVCVFNCSIVHNGKKDDHEYI